MVLDYLPPELILHLGSFLTTGSLAGLTVASKRYNELLAPRLYDPEFLGFWNATRRRCRYTSYNLQYYPQWNCAKHWKSPYIIDCFSKMSLEAIGFHDEEGTLGTVGWTWPHVFAFVGNLRLLKIMLAKGLEVNLTLRSGESLLYLATMNEHLPVVQYLLDAGGDMWQSDNHDRGSTPFENAIDTGRVDLVILFIYALKAASENINELGYLGSLVLRRALGYPRILAPLLASGADPFMGSDFPLKQGTALHFACRQGEEEACEILTLVMKRDYRGLSVRDYEGNTPLHIAAAFGDDCGFICRQLLEAGADLLEVNNTGWNPMDMAVARVNKAAFRLFLEYGPPTWPPETLVAHLPKLELDSWKLPTLFDFVKQLTQAGKISFNWSMKGSTGLNALHHACKEMQTGHSWQFSQFLKKINLLLENGADPDVPDNDRGETFLHALLRYLPHDKWLSYTHMNHYFGYSRNKFATRTSSGDTVLHYATRIGHNRIATQLLHKLDRDTVFAINDPGETALHTAASGEDRQDMLQEALAVGFDVSARNKKGQTPLHIAAGIWGNWGAVHVLVQAGSDVSAVDDSGKPPMHYAAEKEDDLSVGYLVEAGADLHAGCDICEEFVLIWRDMNRKRPWNDKDVIVESTCEAYNGLDEDAPTIWGNCFEGI